MAPVQILCRKEKLPSPRWQAASLPPMLIPVQLPRNKGTIMQLGKVRRADGSIGIGLCEQGRVRLLDLSRLPGAQTLSAILHADDPAALVRSLPAGEPLPAKDLQFLAP